LISFPLLPIAGHINEAAALPEAGRRWAHDGQLREYVPSRIEVRGRQRCAVPSEIDVYTKFNDPQRDEWGTKILPFLRREPVQVIIDATGISRRTVQRIRNEQTKPTAEYRRLLASFAKNRNFGF
jgi:hypothetical protein